MFDPIGFRVAVHFRQEKKGSVNKKAAVGERASFLASSSQPLWAFVTFFSSPIVSPDVTVED